MKAGENWLIMTVTHYILGTIESIDKDEIWLKKGSATWVAVTGRLYNFMKVGVIKETEAEPFGEVRVMVKQAAIVTTAEWLHPLPDKQQ